MICTSAKRADWAALAAQPCPRTFTVVARNAVPSSATSMKRPASFSASRPIGWASESISGQLRAPPATGLGASPSNFLLIVTSALRSARQAARLRSGVPWRPSRQSAILWPFGGVQARPSKPRLGAAATGAATARTASRAMARKARMSVTTPGGGAGCGGS